jgi:hypothetical protein
VCDYRRGIDWWIGFIDTLVHTTRNYNYSAIGNLHTVQITTAPSMPTAAFQSSPVVSWQRIHNSLTVTTAHMMFSLHNLIPFFPSVLNHLQLSSSSDSLNSDSAELGSSLYSLGADPTENTVSIVIAQQFFACCLLIRCCANVFIELLSSNERLLWLRYSGFQASCYITNTRS